MELSIMCTYLDFNVLINIHSPLTSNKIEYFHTVSSTELAIIINMSHLLYH